MSQDLSQARDATLTCVLNLLTQCHNLHDAFGRQRIPSRSGSLEMEKVIKLLQGIRNEAFMGNPDFIAENPIRQDPPLNSATWLDDQPDEYLEDLQAGVFD